MSAAEHLKPTYARNMRLIGHSDQAGRSDGQQIMVRGGYAYIGHVCSKGCPSSGDLRQNCRLPEGRLWIIWIEVMRHAS